MSDVLRESLRQALRERIIYMENQLTAEPERHLPDMGILHQVASLYLALQAVENLGAYQGDGAQKTKA